MSNDELFDKSLEQQLNLLRVEEGFRSDVLAKLKKLEDKIIAKIFTQGETVRLNRLLRQVRNIIETDFKNINKTLQKNITSLAKIQSNRQKAIISGSLGVESISGISASKINKLYKDVLIQGAPSSVWWGRQSQSLKRSFEDNMREGVLFGETLNQLVQRVRGTRAAGFNDGIMSTTTRNAEALVRSSVQAVNNAARVEVLKANDDVIKYFMHVSTLDSRTSTQCVVRDGLKWNAKTLKPVKHNLPFREPPLHWNCRSAIIGLVDDKLAQGLERASSDGPVKASTTFEKWLEGKDSDFQNQVLGVGKSKLWRDGKITFQQLLNQKGNPLTLKQLEEKYT